MSLGLAAAVPHTALPRCQRAMGDANRPWLAAKGQPSSAVGWLCIACGQQSCICSCLRASHLSSGRPSLSCDGHPWEPLQICDTGVVRGIHQRQVLVSDHRNDCPVSCLTELCCSADAAVNRHTTAMRAAGGGLVIAGDARLGNALLRGQSKGAMQKGPNLRVEGCEDCQQQQTWACPLQGQKPLEI